MYSFPLAFLCEAFHSLSWHFHTHFYIVHRLEPKEFPHLILCLVTLIARLSLSESGACFVLSSSPPVSIVAL